MSSENGARYVTYKFAITSGLTILGLMFTLFGIALGYASKVKDEVLRDVHRHEQVPHHDGAMPRDLILREFNEIKGNQERSNQKLDRLLNRGC